jgi:hypothetical protein
MDHFAELKSNHRHKTGFSSEGSLKTAATVDGAPVVTVAPKEFKANSILLSQAHRVPEIECDWRKMDYFLATPHKMTKCVEVSVCRQPLPSNH